MAQLTGTEIVALARLWAQDTSTVDPAVSDDQMLLLLNDVILRYTGDVQQKTYVLPASFTGLTFNANVSIVTTGVDIGEILSAHPSDSSSANTLLTPGLELKTVREILDLYNDTGSGSQSGTSSGEWQYYAWEKLFDEAGDGETTATDYVRVYVWPSLTRTRYLTLRTARYSTLSALTGYPDVSERDARIIARFLAWENARLHSRDSEFLGQILAPLPNTVLNAYFEAGMKNGWLPNSVLQTSALDG